LPLVAAVAIAAAAEPPTGLQRLTDLWRLPEIALGVRTFGTSSFDPTGGNNDGFSGVYSRLYWDRTANVLYDAEGPGCVYRIWFTLLNPVSHLKFYIDDNPLPALDVLVPDFFAGRTAPFSPPLVWDAAASSGGYVSYVPICYQRRLVITASVWTFFFNITAQSYRSDVSTTNFTGGADYSAVRRMYDPAAAGTDPKDLAGVVYEKTRLRLAPGATAPIFSRAGFGEIASLRLRPAAFDANTLQRVRLIASFDGAAPSVDMPLALFFGAVRPKSKPAALLFGRRADELYSFFPMPFFTSAQLALASDSAGPIEIDAEVGWRPRMPDDYAATFAAVQSVSAPTKIGQDHVFAALTGQGKIVGVVQESSSDNGQYFLEGDERYWADGQRSPTIQGTGTEDYYNGGWYFKNGPFSLPTHGLADEFYGPAGLTLVMYRQHVADSLEFYDGATFSIEHDATDDYDGETYRSCTFVYRVAEPALVLAEEFSLGDPAARRRVQYAGAADRPVGPDRFTYEGVPHPEPVEEAGVRSTGAARFTVRVNPHNDGIRLVRRIDQKEGRETVRVRIDGVDAGVWRAPERNASRRWRDAVFDPPPALTQGKEVVEISLANETPGRAYTQYHYWIYNWKRPLLTRLTDLTLGAPADALRVGEEMPLTAIGQYRSGHTVETAGWVNYRLSDPALARIEFGRLRALAPGELTIAATTAALTSNAIRIVIVGRLGD
jgi:hypothetical protein